MGSKDRALWLLGRSAMTGALGGLLFGFDTAVIAGATHPLSVQYALSPLELGNTVAIALWGTVAGALGSGAVGQRIGSRAALRIMAVLYVVSALGCAFAPSWLFFMVARFVGGLGIGGSSVLGPVYIAELAPARWRGRLVGLFQIMIVVGILLAYLSNAIVQTFHFGLVEWRVELGVAFVPALVFFLLLLSVPQSSRWLVSQNRVDEAMLTLTRMGSPDSRAEVDAIVESLKDDGGAANARLFTRRNALSIFLAVSIGMFNQLTGINAILYYLNDILPATWQTVAIGFANLLATLLGMALIDRAGRKTLLLAGAAGCCICLAGVGAVFYAGASRGLLLPLLVGFIVFFAVSQGSVIWVYLSEVFPTPVRSKGQSLGSSAHWITNGLITLLFPWAKHLAPGLPFLFFAAMTALQLVVVARVYPETKGLSLEMVQRKLRGRGFS